MSKNNTIQEAINLNILLLKNLDDTFTKYQEIIHIVTIRTLLEEFFTAHPIIKKKDLKLLAEHINQYNYQHKQAASVISGAWIEFYPTLIVELIKNPLLEKYQTIYYLPDAQCIDSILDKLNLKEQKLVFSSVYRSNSFEPTPVFNKLINFWGSYITPMASLQADSVKILNAEIAIGKKLYHYHKALNPLMTIKNHGFLEDYLISVGFHLSQEEFLACWKQFYLPYKELRKFQGLINFFPTWTFEEHFDSKKSTYLRFIVNLYQKKNINFNLTIGYPHNQFENNLLEFILAVSPTTTDTIKWLKWGLSQQLKLRANYLIQGNPNWMMLLNTKEDTQLWEHIDELKFNFYQKNQQTNNFFAYLCSFDNPEIYLDSLLSYMEGKKLFYYDVDLVNLLFKHVPFEFGRIYKNFPYKLQASIRRYLLIWEQDHNLTPIGRQVWEKIFLLPMAEKPNKHYISTLL